MLFSSCFLYHPVCCFEGNLENTRKKTGLNVILTRCRKSDVQTEKYFLWIILVACKKDCAECAFLYCVKRICQHSQHFGQIYFENVLQLIRISKTRIHNNANKITLAILSTRLAELSIGGHESPGTYGSIKVYQTFRRRS